jgi:insertion element IS1 protein InsB
MEYIANDCRKPYERIIPREKQLQTKAGTFTVEGYNRLCRHFSARMRRKSKGYSRKMVPGMQKMKYAPVLITLLSLTGFQAQHIEIRIADGNNVPIEGVHVRLNTDFWYSNREGIVSINTERATPDDTLYISHLSYKPALIPLSRLARYGTFPEIHLESNVRPLPEVTVSAFNAAKYAEEAIRMIPENYADPYLVPLHLNAEISYGTGDPGAERKLLDFKGTLHFFYDRKKIYAVKTPERETVSPDLGENIFFNKPSDALSLVSIKRHHIIRRYGKYDFYIHEFIDRKGVDAVKIYFKEKGNNPYSGHLIIDRSTKGILQVCYGVRDVEKAIVGTLKGRGLVTTGYGNYYVEAEYSQNDTGKYIFVSGQQNIDAVNRWKKGSASISSTVCFTRADGLDMPVSGNKKELKDIF